MNDKLKSSPEYTPKIERPSPFLLLDALRVQYKTQEEVIAHLNDIEEKLKLVPAWVQLTVAEILRSSLEKNMANTGLLTAAIMAINPSKIVSDLAANDETYEQVSSLVA
jgi:hypothetical protein